jgi:predicted dithiol-disulfide oxidoreductase (DUF899 family)
MSITFPGESGSYREARDRLLDREHALRVEMEAVAAERRALPPGGEPPEDYPFTAPGPDGTATTVRLSELFTADHDALAIYSFMFPRDPDDDRPGAPDGETARLALAQSPCPSCTALLDQLDGTARHARERMDLVVAAKAPLARLLAFAGERGWRHLRLVSAAGTDYNRDYHGELPDGRPRPMLNVFRRDAGTVRHSWGSELLYAPTEPGQDTRHVGTLEPLWNLLDLTPGGRGGDWEEQLDYDCCRREKDEESTGARPSTA